MARKKKMNSMTPVWIVLMIIVSAVMLMVGSTYFGSVGETEKMTTPSGQVVVCGSETTPDLLIQAYDSENVGTAIAEAFIYRKVGSKTWNAGTTGTDETGLEAGAEYEIVLGISATDFVDNAYGEKFTHVVKCQEDETIERPMYNDEIETSLTSTFYNNDDNALAETYVAGDELVVSLRLKAGADEFFGNPTLAGNPNVLVLKLNSSEWDTPNSVYLDDGTELKRISTPLRYDQQASGFIEYAYELPVISDKQVNINLDLNADDTNAPSVDGTAYIYASNYFVNDAGEVVSGVETDEAGAVGTDAPDSVVLDFTA